MRDITVLMLPRHIKLSISVTLTDDPQMFKGAFPKSNKCYRNTTWTDSAVFCNKFCNTFKLNFVPKVIHYRPLHDEQKTSSI